MSLVRRMNAWELKKRKENLEFGAISSYLWDKHIEKLYALKAMLEDLGCAKEEVTARLRVHCKYSGLVI